MLSEISFKTPVTSEQNLLFYDKWDNCAQFHWMAVVKFVDILGWERGLIRQQFDSSWGGLVPVTRCFHTVCSFRAQDWSKLGGKPHTIFCANILSIIAVTIGSHFGRNIGPRYSLFALRIQSAQPTPSPAGIKEESAIINWLLAGIAELRPFIFIISFRSYTLGSYLRFVTSLWSARIQF